MLPSLLRMFLEILQPPHKEVAAHSAQYNVMHVTTVACFWYAESAMHGGLLTMPGPANTSFFDKKKYGAWAPGALKCQ